MVSHAFFPRNMVTKGDLKKKYPKHGEEGMDVTVRPEFGPPESRAILIGEHLPSGK